jgi:hypothetical protein
MSQKPDFPLGVSNGENEINIGQRRVQRPDWLPRESPQSAGWREPGSTEEWHSPEAVNIPRLDEVDVSSGSEPDANQFNPLAWYRRHHVKPQQWGIYIREYGIIQYQQHITEVLQEEYGIPVSVADPAIRELAYQRLISHEWFHFQIEYLTYILEDATTEPLSERYISKVYNKQWPTIFCIEESLANAFVARSERCSNILSRITGGYKDTKSEPDWKRVMELTTKAPPAYEQFERFVSDNEFISGCQTLCYQIQTTTTHPQDNRGDGTGALGSELPFNYADTPDNWGGTVPLRILPIESDSHV